MRQCANVIQQCVIVPREQRPRGEELVTELKRNKCAHKTIYSLPLSLSLFLYASAQIAANFLSPDKPLRLPPPPLMPKPTQRRPASTGSSVYVQQDIWAPAPQEAEAGPYHPRDQREIHVSPVTTSSHVVNLQAFTIKKLTSS